MIKAALALLKLDQAHLAALSGVSRKAIALIEKATPGKIDARRRTVLEAVRTRLEIKLHVVFILADDTTGEGVRIGKPKR